MFFLGAFDKVQLQNELESHSFLNMYYDKQNDIYQSVLIFALFDCLIIFLQASSINSLSYFNLKKFFSNVNNILKFILKFSMFYTFNILILFTLVFFTDTFLLQLGMSSSFSLFLILFCVIFRIHSWVQTTILYICGLFSPRQEFVELFFNGTLIQEYYQIDYVGQNKYRFNLNKIIRFIRKYIYRFFFSNENVEFYMLFLNDRSTIFLEQKQPLNSRFLRKIEILDYLLRLIIPHVFTLMCNFKTGENYFEECANIIPRIIVYIFLTFMRVYFLMHIIIYLASKTNIV